ncbi:2-amino-3-ketobutyrate coenzyme A ligase [Candidatus Protochlamydia naegleriophila]|uniref:2-amino-3-ketobutyrate coenzyme A ligase n=1 Tax=Candidatus Protochlamydia naegleriophila TaxID=389348 RepID=A0A0U5JAY1_9BACT|nr:glycine C-acetyltransferase [Candidatus Protochlamydia naegleriophila]CUI16590.1 2-amino-3-ketobutyrate coenzyme A ligase [Candidatus Protochlamydia naegleriophila]
MDTSFLTHIENQLEELKTQGLYKQEREITSPQDAEITVAGSKKVLNFCSNNYLGLANHSSVIRAAMESYSHYGFGLSSVRFICGTQTVHKELERRLSHFLGTDETILYCSCFDANGGLFETLLGPEDAVISDALNHASIIDGIRLCKAKRLRYDNNNMKSLEEQLKEAKDSRFRLIATDGVFSMDGTIADLHAICDLADEYQALVMVDDCHAVGFMGAKGRGTSEFCDVMGRVDLITGTLGKALGGALGGYTSGRKPLIDWLRQRSRPYLFSNTLAPSIAAASLKVLDLIEGSDDRRERLQANSRYFRERMTSLGFNLVPGSHPIIPVMLGDAKLAQEFAARMLEEGVYVIGFAYPVVPQGKARIRTQMCANHTQADLDRALQAFEKVGKDLKVIS